MQYVNDLHSTKTDNICEISADVIHCFSCFMKNTYKKSFVDCDHWVVVLCGLVGGYQHFGRIYLCLHGK
jgi:hypothetical protein